MIESLEKDICEIWRRQASGKYGVKSADKYDLFASDEPCLFLPSTGEEVINDEAGNDIVVDGKLRSVNEIKSTDRIVLDDYNYDVIRVKEKINLMTETIEYYEAVLARRRKHAETASVQIR